jgi:hypothetical protein
MINGYPYINLEKFVDLTEFDALHAEICRGIATSKHLAVNGLQKINPGSINPNSQGYSVKALYDVYSHWQSLPNNDPLKIAGLNLDYNQTTTYLKYALGGYDLYSLYRLLDEADNSINLTEINSHFPKLTSWIINFKTSGVFSSIHSSTLITLEAGGIPWEHYDPEVSSDVPGMKSEFIHIKTDLDRPFYILDPNTNTKVYMNTRVAWWDENVWHGGEPINRPTYTLRITGKFSESFMKRIMSV